MHGTDAAAAYRQASIENAPPIKIIRMLLDGGIRFVDRALQCDPKDPSTGFLEWVGRADDVVCELRLALDPTHSEELCANMESLYLFCEQRFGQAVGRREHPPLEEARQVLATLREAWADVELSSRESI